MEFTKKEKELILEALKSRQNQMETSLDTATKKGHPRKRVVSLQQKVIDLILLQDKIAPRWWD